MNNTNVYRCNLCEKEYNNWHARHQHKKRVHFVSSVKSGFPCKEENCSYIYKGVQDLKQHLAGKHGFKFEEEEKTFASTPDFVNWKASFEKDEKCSFIKNGRRCTNNNITTYYCCNRSGSYTSANTGKRKLRKSCKSGYLCTANIVQTVNKLGNVRVSICSTHYGHDIELKFIRLTRVERNLIAKMVADKIPNDVILSNIRKTLKDDVERIHLLTSRDVLNIGHSFGVSNLYMKHSDDAQSVCLLAKELASFQDANPIVFIKFQEQNQINIDHIAKEDFFLVMQHPLQLEMMKKFGHKGICIDKTHGTNRYNFNLISILVIDENGEGFPCAWLICNKEDQIVLVEFLKLIKCRTGPIIPKFVMTDDADQYFNAWSDVYGQGPQKLLCAWHLDEIWKQNLGTISDLQLQCMVYKTLCTLASEPDPQKFHLLLIRFLECLFEDVNCKNFHRYFLNTYAHRTEQWATCFRLHAGINTNMYVEAFHHVFKFEYLKGKVNQRLDKYILMLLNYVRDKGFDRITKLVKGKPISRLSANEQRHRQSLLIDFGHITKSRENIYCVQSQTTSDRKYTVGIKLSSCTEDCQLQCASCQVCVHSSFCNCLDSLIHGVICEHVHAVCAYSQNQETLDFDIGHVSKQLNDKKELTASSDPLQTVLLCIEDNSHSDISSLQSNISGLISELRFNVPKQLNDKKELTASSDPLQTVLLCFEDNSQSDLSSSQSNISGLISELSFNVPKQLNDKNELTASSDPLQTVLLCIEDNSQPDLSSSQSNISGLISELSFNVPKQLNDKNQLTASSDPLQTVLLCIEDNSQPDLSSSQSNISGLISELSFNVPKQLNDKNELTASSDPLQTVLLCIEDNSQPDLSSSQSNISGLISELSFNVPKQLDDKKELTASSDPLQTVLLCIEDNSQSDLSSSQSNISGLISELSFNLPKQLNDKQELAASSDPLQTALLCIEDNSQSDLSSLQSNISELISELSFNVNNAQCSSTLQEVKNCY